MVDQAGGDRLYGSLVCPAWLGRVCCTHTCEAGQSWRRPFQQTRRTTQLRMDSHSSWADDCEKHGKARPWEGGGCGGSSLTQGAVKAQFASATSRPRFSPATGPWGRWVRG